MARLRSPEKRSAILQAAVREIAHTGLGAATAKIAERAGIAAGTLFTYFPSKDDLLNELYLELKSEVYARMNSGFPHTANLERRVAHVWSSYLGWAIDFPEKRKVSVLLNLSDLVTPATRAKAASQRAAVGTTLHELEERAEGHGLPRGFATAAMASMQEAAMEFAAKQPKKRAQLIERSFQAFWRAMR